MTDVPVSSHRAGDAALLAAAAGGDESAVRLLLQQYGGLIYSCALRLTGEPESAEEVTHDVLLAAMRNAARFRGESTLGTWLYRMTINRARDRLRRIARSRETGMDGMSAQPSTDAGPARRVELLELREHIDRAMAALPDEMREVIALRYASGLEYQEIADVMGCSKGLVGSRLHRALKRLGRLLHERGLTEEAF